MCLFQHFGVGEYPGCPSGIDAYTNVGVECLHAA